MASQEQSARRFEIEGWNLGYPTQFRDGCSAAGLFVVSTRSANDLLTESGFEVAEIAPGKAILALTCVHYSDTDCGTYDEMAEAFFVQRVGRRPRIPYVDTWRDIIRGQIASHSWKLQVTTALSQQAGIRMWGFPKTIEQISFERAGGRATFSLQMDGSEVLRYSVQARGTRTPAPITSPVYSIFEGAPHVGHLTQAYGETGYALGGGRLDLGHHPFADQLRRLGLQKRPLLATWNGHLAFSMSAPEKL